MANTLLVNLADCPADFPLRGNMTGAALNFTPTSKKFRVKFFTKDANQYAITSTTHPFLGLQDQAQTQFVFGGKRGLFVTFGYNQKAQAFELIDTNLVSGDGGSGGGTGTALSIAVDSTETVASTMPASVENVGTDTNLRLKFKVPRGADGEDGQDGEDGTDATGGVAVIGVPPGGTVTQYLGKTGDGNHEMGWLTLPTGTGGGTSGGTFSPEVLLTQNAAGEITPNNALGNNFTVIKTKPLIIKNPVGYEAGERVYIIHREGPDGPYPTDWGSAYAFNNRQPPRFPQQPGALVEIEMKLTADIDADNKGGWLTRVSPGLGENSTVIGYGVSAFIARNITTGKQYYVMRSPTVPAADCAMTDMKPGETLKILRNGLGTEAFGAVEFSGTALITGALPNGNRAELHTGPGVRAAFDRGVLAFSGDVTATAQDLIISGARELDVSPGSCQGVSIASSAKTTLRNMLIYDNENGLLSGNADFLGTLAIFDTVFRANGVGDRGYTHNIYMGRHPQGWTAIRSNFEDCVGGHNVKSRSGITTLTQCLIRNSREGREIDLPNGGRLYLTDSLVHHPADGQQNDSIRIGAEGIEPRAREYIIRNTHLRNDKPLANQGSFVWNEDPDVDVQVIDCTFQGPDGTNFQWAGANAQGMRGRVVVSFTGGPVGPRLPVGYQPISVTQIA